MPSITYIEDNGSGKDSDGRIRANDQRSPEPPSRYDSNSPAPAQPAEPTPGQDFAEYASIRRLVTAAQIMAIVSLLIGGVLLSSVSLIVAIVASRKLKQCAYVQRTGTLDWQALKRATTIAIVIAALALVANAVALAVIYPMVMDAIQSGQYSELLAGTPNTPSTSGTSTWG